MRIEFVYFLPHAELKEYKIQFKRCINIYLYQ